MTDKRSGTAWVLAGGGALGAVQAGMLQALLADGHLPDALIGTSAGALNAAFIGYQPTVDRARELGEIWTSLRRKDVFPIGSWRNVLGLFSHSALVSGDPLKRLLSERLGYDRLEQAVIPVCVVATDAENGVEVRFEAGPAVPALLASSAIPGVLPVVRHGERQLIDGGVANHTPISTAIDLGFERIVVLPTTSFTSRKPPQNAAALALHSLTLLIRSQMARDIQFYADQAEIILVPPLLYAHVAPYDFSQAAPLIEAAALQTRRWLEEEVGQGRVIRSL